jgi:hypothetical protein|tara:strand:+ start:250 stop:453 length:204 start_codon:yes stop_codon:yes gene_type:complete
MKREKNESYEDYKKRRAEDNKKQKRRLEGIKVWPGDWGTYRRLIHGDVEDKLKSIMDKMKNKMNKDD